MQSFQDSVSRKPLAAQDFMLVSEALHIGHGPLVGESVVLRKRFEHTARYMVIEGVVETIVGTDGLWLRTGLGSEWVRQDEWFLGMRAPEKATP